MLYNILLKILYARIIEKYLEGYAAHYSQWIPLDDGIVVVFIFVYWIICTFRFYFIYLYQKKSQEKALL